MRLASEVEFRELLVQNLKTGTALGLEEMFDHF